MTALSPTQTPLLTAPPAALGRGHAAAGVQRPSNLNLPNALTAGRLLVVPFFALLLVGGLASTDARLLAAGLFVLTCLTDIVDGYLARSRNQVTAFGVMADPIADKALMGTALLGLSLLGLLPWWVTAVVLGREAAITLMRTAMLRRGLLPANRGGKLKCLTQNAAVTLYLLPLTDSIALIREPVLWLAVVLTVATAVPYVVSAFRLRPTPVDAEQVDDGGRSRGRRC
jgi:CDP-diacylglycerol--glycerol-3-phosphate 3-phosphatidyltransferase